MFCYATFMGNILNRAPTLVYRASQYLSLVLANVHTFISDVASVIKKCKIWVLDNNSVTAINS